MNDDEAWAAVIMEHYVKPVEAAIREMEADMHPAVREFLTSLPNGHVWEELRRERETEGGP